MFMEISNQYDIELKQINVKTYLLHWYFEETIYMEQLEGLVEGKS